LYDDTKRAVYDYEMTGPTSSSSNSAWNAKMRNAAAGADTAGSNPFTNAQQRNNDYYYYTQSTGWSNAYAQYSTENQEHRSGKSKPSAAKQQMYSERMKNPHPFSDPYQRKRAAEEDVNYKNSYARFYNEYYSENVDSYRRKVIRDTNRRERERVMNPPGYRDPTFFSDSFINPDAKSSDDQYEADPIVRQGTFAIVSIEGALILLVALFVIRGVWIKSQEGEYPTTNLSASKTKRF
jgi:hypothetical protein